MSVFSHYPGVWDEAMEEEVVRSVDSWGELANAQEVVDFLVRYYPEAYLVMTEGLDPSSRAYEMLREKYGARDG